MLSHTTDEIGLKSRFTGLLIGQAVGDALGLPWEGISRRRALRICGAPDRYRFLFGRGMISDDTEHACMTAQAILAFPGDADLFARSLGWKLRWWLAGLPAGIGFATLRAIVKLWIGVPPHSSGVFSAGNGPSMRAPILGAWFNQDAFALQKYIRASTRLTHTDPKAEEGALMIGYAARWAVRTSTDDQDPSALLEILMKEATDPEMGVLLNRIAKGLSEEQSVEEFAYSLGLEEGVSGYMYHTVPIAIYAFSRHMGDFEITVKSVIALGGDTDSVAAAAGALAGAAAGYENIPSCLVEGICEWPRSVSWMKRLAHRLTLSAVDSSSASPISLFWPGMILRNLLFLVVVLAHGFRRLLPPY